ncbi:tyrosine-protein phosphatase YwqE [Clostridium homopropionicum DSM 5847]|uniref:protein-tyrosine-phosphatase n=1 Tax=Clostridium homopropionicum DSM 5847 TaxID=1121318 RepID=A0A0L6ZC95_9CLOT|nr:CpsB/CapC family capsule biosynthesis tyrosine phosphatase [Clostridium homopropionicum]KOA20586.1 tyrosine-protein phosphatase YwqE [Clostridium homopropionicum DSM 5847]SFF93778.1 protein-tyrosine phosphatase [Clostridium homopropionicum]
MIDIHCHILPGIDDGAKDMEMSLEMLRIAEEDGIKKIIATPHFYRGYFENQYKDIEKSVEELNKAAKENNINVEVLPGQEIFLDNHTLQDYKEGAINCLNYSGYMLIELPNKEIPKYTFDIIYELRLLGVKTIIAHPERYYFVEKDIKILNRFIEEGCLFQLNATSLNGTFGKKIQKTAINLMKNGLCNFVASDAHSTTRRIPKLKSTLMEIKHQNKQIYEKVINNANNLSNRTESLYSNRKIKENKELLARFKRIININ